MNWSPLRPQQEIRAWWGRVFGATVRHGAHTVIVKDPSALENAQLLASHFGVPDTAVVTSISPRSVQLRSFSPHMEVEQCFQTSLAVMSALAAPIGEPWEVGHHEGAPLRVVREPGAVWASVPHQDRPGVHTAHVPDGFPRGEAVLLRHTRSRLHVRLDDVEDLERLQVASTQVMRICEQEKVSGVVVSGPVRDQQVRVRVFTTSFEGAEDLTTGGAVWGVGFLEALDGRRGAITALQGPDLRQRHGRLLLRLRHNQTVDLGGEVVPLMEGSLLL